MPDPRDAASPESEIDAESAIVLPNREAMSIIDPSFVTRLVPTPPNDTADPNAATTGQGIDESNPNGSA